MGTVHETAASLRVSGPDLIPEDISSRLGRKPDFAYRKGQPRPLPNGRFGAPTRNGLWSLSVERRHPGNLDVQITELLDCLPDDISVWHQLTDDFEVEVFCGLFIIGGNQGLTLQPSTLAALSLRRLKLDLDLYAAD